MVNTIVVRRNGQAQLRENLRAAIKQAGRTQSSVAAAAGVKYTHLAGGLNGNNWMTRDAVAALARELEVSVDELMGTSIFKDQTDRFAEFDDTKQRLARRAAEVAAEQKARCGEIAAGKTRALCCTCGSLRTIPTKGIYAMDSEGESWGFSDRRGGGRYLRTMKCFTCGEQTRHAILRADDNRDVAEQWDQAPTLLSLARAELAAELERLAGFNVEVTFRQQRRKNRTKGFAVAYDYDEAKSQWRIEIDPNLPPRAQVRLLKSTWDKIARNEFDVDWDPRDGVIVAPSDTCWEAVTDDLMQDMTRFLSVERRKLVQQARDDIEAGS